MDKYISSYKSTDGVNFTTSFYFAFFLITTYIFLVCISVLTRFYDTLSKEEKSDKNAIEKSFKKWCKAAKLKENRFCYFLGGTEDAATGILGEMSKPLSWGVPPEKVCEKLKKKDKQVCELRYGNIITIIFLLNFIK